MPDSKSPASVRELLAAMESSFLEDESACFKLNGVEADKQLAEFNVNPQPALKKLGEILETARAQEHLDRAKAQRNAFLAMFATCQKTLCTVSAPIKEKVLAIMQGISPNRTEAVEAYFRKFEQSSEKDVRGLMEDLEMLRAMKKETDKDDSKPNQG